MATALPLATSFTDASTTEAQEKTALGNLRAALAEMGDPMGQAGVIQNLSLVFTVGSNALTCNVKTRAGAAPSATDPVSAALRNATPASGDFNVRNITAALSLVISSGSTLGHASTVPGFIYWYLIDNAGTLELAASTTYLGANGIVTTVAEGGAGAADSAVVAYSTTARSNVPFICVGRTIDTQTTAGTWAAVPSAAQLTPLDDFYQGPKQNSQSANYTTVLADANNDIYHPAGDNNPRTFTIDSNANVAYPTGTTLTFINEINTLTIAITSDTLVMAGTGATGSRTLAANGIATAKKVTATRWQINGVNLT